MPSFSPQDSLVARQRSCCSTHSRTLCRPLATSKDNMLLENVPQGIAMLNSAGLRNVVCPGKVKALSTDKICGIDQKTGCSLTLQYLCRNLSAF